MIDLPHADSVSVHREAPALVARLEHKVLPERKKAAAKELANDARALAANPKVKPKRHHQTFLDVWWKHAYRREDMLRAFARLPRSRFIALTRVAAEGRMSVYVFADVSWRPDDSLATFALDDDYSFGVLSSSIHRAWFDERCSKLKVDPRYTSTTVWDSFPWPVSPSPDQVRSIAQLSAEVIEVRLGLLDQGSTLGGMYDAIREPGKSELRQVHERLDEAVLDAYGFAADDDLLAQLLALNLGYAADPATARRPGGSAFGDDAYASEYRLEPDRLV